ncbi:hypothetical protein WH47_00649 [Habropoda laboriosa]|uniref:Uncharacterized protein n=1 Tax=Habropoda laboriosa TaxID=597456 RepID=A0A0L7RI54_9HYME|nr:hypothetical protein WH47_00649 [Habropoda laboriosa]
MIRIPGNVVFRRLLTPLFNTYVRGLSIGSQSGIAAILAMDSLGASSRLIGRPSGDLEKKGGRLLVLLHQYCGGECPRAAKGGCCFLRTGWSRKTKREGSSPRSRQAFQNKEPRCCFTGGQYVNQWLAVVTMSRPRRSASLRATFLNLRHCHQIDYLLTATTSHKGSSST